MVLRDQKGDQIMEADWQAITGLLEQAWAALQAGLKSNG
jgi:hypothetical protein